jgi:hypothetical protein
VGVGWRGERGVCRGTSFSMPVMFYCNN